MDTKNTNDKKTLFTFLTSLFGFRKKGSVSGGVKDNIEFVKVDLDSDLRTTQAKIERVFKTKMTQRLEELFNSWLTDTTDTYDSLRDRHARLSQLDFAVMNDPFLGFAAELYADEATQLDEINGKLITVDCADSRMQRRMYDLMEQWGITQNRVRSAIYNLVLYGDAFWANKVTDKGVLRIIPLDVYQVRERLEFNPTRVASDLSFKKGNFQNYVNRNQKLKILMDIIEEEANDEFADLFDKKLFGFVLTDDLVVPPWNITHFRLNHEQSPFYPFGTPVFLKALAPFRQLNATMILQSLARAMSFPVTVYEVTTHEGMDEATQFERVNEVREEYENIGDTSPGSDAYSVNTKLWVPKGLVNLTMHTPNIDLNAIGDLEMLENRVAIASGIPRGYLANEFGNFGVSAISLIEQYKPFARRVFTAQSAFLEGLSNLFRLHFAITGEFDFRESFVLSLKFPASEGSQEKLDAKKRSLELTGDVLDLISNVIGMVDEPIPLDILRDILKKFSFLSDDDINKWIKKYAKKPDQNKADFSSVSSGGGSSGFSAPSGGMESPGEESPEPEGTQPTSPPEEGGSEEPSPEGGEETVPPEEEEVGEERPEESFHTIQQRIREEKLIKRYIESRKVIYEGILEKFKAYEELNINNRHYKYTGIPADMDPMFKTVEYIYRGKGNRERIVEDTLKWEVVKDSITLPDEIFENDEE